MTEAEINRAILDGLRRVAPECDPAALRPDENIRETLDIDSFDFLNFLIGLHDALGVEIPEADYGKLSTMGAMMSYLMAKC
jgi:acyl carrier protein